MAMALLLPGAAGAGGGQEPGATPVRTAPVEIVAEALPVEAAGILSRKAEVTLSFPTPGVLAEVPVRAGDEVRRGRTLARLDPREIEARLAQAEAAAEKARRDEERAGALHASGAIGDEEYEHLQTARRQAVAALQAAEFVRRYAVIEAPAAGRVVRRMAEPNQTVAAGQPILGFAADEEGWLVRAALSGRDVLRVRVGDRAVLRAAARPDEPFAATVTHIAAGSDERTRATEIELTPDAAPDALRSGFIVHAAIQPAPVAPRPRVPASALVEGDGREAGLFVLEADGTRVRRVTVRVESLHGEHAYLSTPLPPDTRVVTRGAEFVRDGGAVTSESP